MDSFARGLKAAAKILEEGVLEKIVKVEREQFIWNFEQKLTNHPFKSPAYCIAYDDKLQSCGLWKYRSGRLGLKLAMPEIYEVSIRRSVVYTM